MLAGSSLFVLQPAWVKQLRDLTFDSYQRMSPRPYTPAPVRIIDIDDESLTKIGQWPWSRSILANLTRRLGEAGAAVIVFDMVFAEPDRQSPMASAQRWQVDAETAARLAQLPDPDQQFAAAIADYRVVLGTALSDAPSANTLKTRAIVSIKGEAGDWLYSRNGAIQNLKIFQDAASGIGTFDYRPDTQSVIRSVPVMFKHAGSAVPSLSVEAVRLALGERLLRLEFGDQGVGFDGHGSGLQLFAVGRQQIQTDPRGEYWVHFSGRQPKRYVSAKDLLAGDFDTGLISGHIVLIGTSAAGLHDLRYTPLGWGAGVEVHAEAIEQMLSGHSLNRPAWALGAELVSTWFGWLIAIGGLVWFGPRWGLALVLSVLALGAGASWYGFVEQGLLLDPTLGSLILVLSFFTASVTRHILTEMETRRIRQTFSSYVSPGLVEHLLEHRDALTLNGELRQCSFVMTDLQGFTGTMEQAEPEQAIQVLNEYLDGMIHIAFRHNGMLDRIVGDAVAVIFSAPLPQTDHARRAVRCALDMDIFAEDFAQRWQARGFPIKRTRIGVHTGKVVLGSVGGKEFKDYRALGDPINTASRLEGANKYLDTRVLISADTAAMIDDFDQQFAMRPAGELLLAGKTEALGVLTPIEFGRDAPADRYLSWFAGLAKDAPDIQKSVLELLAEFPDDPLLKLHGDRLESGERGTLIRLAGK